MASRNWVAGFLARQATRKYPWQPKARSNNDSLYTPKARSNTVMIVCTLHSTIYAYSSIIISGYRQKTLVRKYPKRTSNTRRTCFPLKTSPCPQRQSWHFDLGLRAFHASGYFATGQCTCWATWLSAYFVRLPIKVSGSGIWDKTLNQSRIIAVVYWGALILADFRSSKLHRGHLRPSAQM